jgi:hypothetical protein
MANPEILKKENISPSVFPPEPFVEVRTNGELTRLTLTQALQKIQEEEEKRRNELLQKARNIGKVRPHGSVTPLSRRVQNDVRESLERERKRNPAASSYPLILCILRSSPDNPFQISGEISPRSECFPKEGKEDPFYRFICDRPVTEALKILNQPPEVRHSLWQIFSQRLELHKKVLGGEISPSEALNEFMKRVGKIEYPEDLSFFVREIGKNFPLTSTGDNHRRF